MESLLTSAMVRWCVLLPVFVSLANGEGAYPPSSLRHVNMLYRHGDRSPTNIYPTDINQVDSWPDGLGWLSSIGVEEQHKLGQYLNSRYGGFINVTRYNHDEIVIEASAVRRCLMSAYSNLAGLFPPQGDQVWDSSLLWQPIPVLTKPEVDDNKLAQGASCPRYDQLLSELFHSEEVLSYQEKNKEFLQYVGKSAGVPHENLSILWTVGDTLICERAHNMTWNDWVYTNGTFEKLKQLVVYAWDLLYATPEMARLKGGPLLGEMIQNMKAASDNKPSLTKMHMYSAHDTTVSALLNAMMVFNKAQPPYASVVFVELHEFNSQPFVKIFFRNETDHEPYYFLPPGCEDPCKLSTFERIMEPRVPIDWVEECKVKADGSLNMASKIALGIGSAIAVAIIIGLVISLRRQCRNDYSRV